MLVNMRAKIRSRSTDSMQIYGAGSLLAMVQWGNNGNLGHY